MLQPTLVIQIKNRRRRRQLQLIHQLHVSIQLGLDIRRDLRQCLQLAALDPRARLLLDHVAVRAVGVAGCLDRQWTYDELNRRSNSLRHALIEAGVGLDQAVALLRYPQIGLVNAYGPAECSDDVAFFRVDAASTRGTWSAT